MLLVVENSILFFVFFVIVKIHWRRGWYFMTVSWQLPVCWKEPTFFNSNVTLLCKNNWNRCACVLCVSVYVCGLCDAASANVFILTLPVQMGAVWSGVSCFQPGCLVLICVAFSLSYFSLNTFLIFCFYFSSLFIPLFCVCLFPFLSPCCFVFFHFWVVL